MEANKDQSLARRVQRLQRFLLDKVHHELLKRPEPRPKGFNAAPEADDIDALPADRIVDVKTDTTIDASKSGLNEIQSPKIKLTDRSHSHRRLFILRHLPIRTGVACALCRVSPLQPLPPEAVSEQCLLFSIVFQILVMCRGS